jgi:hypothetical protein
MKKKKKAALDRWEDFISSGSTKAKVAQVLIGMAGFGLLVFGGAIIPGILIALKGLESSGVRNDREKYTKKQIDNALGNLRRKKLIKIIKEKDGKYKIKLTNKGKKRFLKLSLETIKIEKPPIWDRKWRIVIFDIPIKYNQARAALRMKMKELGFKQLQKSVWVHPYECEDEILFTAEVFEVDKYVEIITAEKVLHEKVLKKSFCL